jgi:hypothetical protein
MLVSGIDQRLSCSSPQHVSTATANDAARDGDPIPKGEFE